MSESNFTAVTRFQCKWCGKLFKTDGKHDCKFNPCKRNCFSCSHCLGMEQEKGDGVEGSGLYFLCELGHADGWNIVQDVYLNNWCASCNDYNLRENYKGSETWALVRNIQNARDNVKRMEDDVRRNCKSGLPPDTPFLEYERRNLERLIKELHG